MVAAQSQNASKAGLLSPQDFSKRILTRMDGTNSDKYRYLPSPETCLLHLRLLTAFSLLRQSVSGRNEPSDGQGSEEKHLSEQRWIIFIAKAVRRFERWLRESVLPGIDRSNPYVFCSEEALREAFRNNRHFLDWSKITPPPLDILMVLHSYMLNPRDYLQDSLRGNRVELWKAGFPWVFVEAYLNSTDYSYDLPESSIKTYEQATDDQWVTETGLDISVTCHSCFSTTQIAWSELYPGSISQMEKGNTEMPFTITCGKCHSRITQSSLCFHRFQEDLELLLDRGIPMPGTLLGLDGQVEQPPNDEARPLRLNYVLKSECGHELLKQLQSGSYVHDFTQLTALIASYFGDTVSNTVTDSAQKLLNQDNVPLFQKTLRRMIAIYDRNDSHFALDLVGAVIRQGAFIEKMRDFDWINSPAREQHASMAVDRYLGFFEVMLQNPKETAVPTFDVDLVWHTHQLSPPNYYDFSLKYCNGIFIDHDDKIVDDVLSNSFEWTCDEYVKITGLPYDKCLCWCCALLEADNLARLDQKVPKSGKFRSKLKNALGKFSREEMSEAEMNIVQIQTSKFERDYARAKEESNVKQKSKKDFFDDYIWHYSMYAPSPEMIGA